MKKLFLVDGELNAGAIHYHGAELVEHDAEIAVKRLLAGEAFRPATDKRTATIRKIKECIERNEGATWAGSVKVKLLRDALELLT